MSQKYVRTAKRKKPDNIKMFTLFSLHSKDLIVLVSRAITITLSSGIKPLRAENMF